VIRATFLILAALAAANPAHAEETRLDHRGALGLSLGVGVEHASLVFRTDALDATRLTLDLMPTFAVGTEGNELVGLVRGLRGPDWGAALGFGYRAYFGRDAWKTYFQGLLKADTAPHLAGGVEAGFGVMHEFSALLGVFAQAELSVEVSSGVRVGFGASAGIQARTYVLE